MNSKWVMLIIGISLFLLVTCSMPQGPAVTAALPEADRELAVATDVDRSQGVYLNEKGGRFDIVSVEDPDGVLVRCVEARSITPVNSGIFAARGGGFSPVKALVLGTRDDGYPGVWEVHHNDSIHAIQMGFGGRRCSQLPDADEFDWVLHGLFGWVYTAETLVGDNQGGYIIVGYAENEAGWQRGRWQLDPGTKVVVYWRLAESPNGRFYLVSQSRIVGELKEEYQRFQERRGAGFPGQPSHANRHRWWFNLFGSLRLLFLSRFETYLADYSEAVYVPEEDVYRIKGTDQEGQPSLATIHKSGVIGIEVEEDPGNGGSLERIVIETYHPTDGVITDTTLELLDDQMGHLVSDDNSGTGFSARIDLLGGLETGTYYIKIYSAKSNTGAYAIRLLTLAENDELPAYEYFGATSDDSAYEPDSDGDGNMIKLNPILPGVTVIEALNRRLNSVDDVDWLVFSLP